MKTGYCLKASRERQVLFFFLEALANRREECVSVLWEEPGRSVGECALWGEGRGSQRICGM